MCEKGTRVGGCVYLTSFDIHILHYNLVLIYNLDSNKCPLPDWTIAFIQKKKASSTGNWFMSRSIVLCYR